MARKWYRDARVPSWRPTTLCRVLFAAASLLALAAQALAAETVVGVTDAVILIGTITDLSGVTAIQGVNSANAIRLAFDDVNAKGGIHGRKIRYIVEDSQYQVPRAVQAMNKLLNNDRVFFTIEDGGTPMNNATWPMAIEKGTPKLLPLSPANCARGAAARDLTVDNLLHAMETITDFHDMFGGTYTFTSANHHGATQEFLAVIHNGRWVPVLDHALA